MRLDHLRVVHPIEVIARENHVVVGVVPGEVPGRLAHGIGRSLVPMRIVRRLLGGEDVHEPAAEQIHPIGQRDVAVERRRVELRQHEDAPDVGVDAVADGDVDQPVLAADRHGRLRPMLGERKEPRPLPAAQDDRQDITHA